MPFSIETTRSRFLHALLFTAAFALVLAGCDSAEPDDDGGAGEEELITRVTVTLSPQSGADDVTAVAEDTDEDGELDTIETLALDAGTTYDGEVMLYDGVNDVDITDEVEEEDFAHRFFYDLTGGISDRIMLSGLSTDRNGRTLGREFTLSVTDGDAASGTMNVVLRHFAEREEDDASEKTRGGGSTDIDIDVPVEISAAS